MISDLKEIKCEHCKKQGLRVRSRITKKLVMRDKPVEQIWWEVWCEYCSGINNILAEENW